MLETSNPLVDSPCNEFKKHVYFVEDKQFNGEVPAIHVKVKTVTPFQQDLSFQPERKINNRLEVMQCDRILFIFLYQFGNLCPVPSPFCLPQDVQVICLNSLENAKRQTRIKVNYGYNQSHLAHLNSLQSVFPQILPSNYFHCMYSFQS